MPLTYLGDENLPGRFLRAIHRHNSRGINAIDILRVGEPRDLPLGSPDPAILLWIEKNGRILVTLDEHSLPNHLEMHIQQGHHVPGIFMVNPKAKVNEVVEFLVRAAYASGFSDWQDLIKYIP